MWEILSFGGYKTRLMMFKYVVDLSNFGVVLNSATNFMAYLKPKEKKSLSQSQMMPLAAINSIRQMEKRIETKNSKFTLTEVQTLKKTHGELWEEPFNGQLLGETIVLGIIKQKPGLSR